MAGGIDGRDVEEEQALAIAVERGVEGAEAHKLKITKKSGNVEYYYLDAETYLLVKSEGKTKRRGTEIEGEVTFSDYKDVDGYMLPFTIEQGIKGAPQKQRMTFTKYELNPYIEYGVRDDLTLVLNLFARRVAFSNDFSDDVNVGIAALAQVHYDDAIAAIWNC